VSSAGNGATVVKVEFAQPLAGVPRDFTINTPPRIALDFPNTANGLGRSVQNFTEGELRSANIVQAGTRTRLVINLNQMLAYDTKVDGNNLLITLQGKAPPGWLHRLPHRVLPKSNKAHRSIPCAMSISAAARTVRPHPGRPFRRRRRYRYPPARNDIDRRLPQTSLPRNLQRKLDVVDFATRCRVWTRSPKVTACAW